VGGPQGGTSTQGCTQGEMPSQPGLSSDTRQAYRWQPWHPHGLLDAKHQAGRGAG
jgi:hypothetical protein